MTQAVASVPIPRNAPAGESNWALLRLLLGLALPVLAEHSLHILVNLTDTYLANHLVAQTGPADLKANATNAAAAAAVGSVAYVGWLLGLLTSAVGSGSTAIISRAVGAGDRRTANAALGQSVLMAAVFGTLIGGIAFSLSGWLPTLFNLQTPQAEAFLTIYVRWLALGVPFAVVMFVANDCLRGAGDTLTPAVAMIVVDVVNVLLSFGLTYGWWGLPEMGFPGIAVGTFAAYVSGGLLQVAVLVIGRGGVRLFWHRLRPRVAMMRRLLRIGLPSGAEGMTVWGANFAVLFVINGFGDLSAAAHLNAIRIESLSYMTGMAVATAAATMVGQSLGRQNVGRARRSAYLGFAVGGGAMACFGLAFILFGGHIADVIGNGPTVNALTAKCLFITGFCQIGFAASMVFGAALRGAGDTVTVLVTNLASTFAVRLVGVLIVGQWLRLGLAAVWVVLASELMLRGGLMYLRFLQGKWERVEV